MLQNPDFDIHKIKTVQKDVKPFGSDVMLNQPAGVKSDQSTTVEKSLHKILEGRAYSKMAGQSRPF